MPNNADQKAKADAGKSNPVLLYKDFASALRVINRVLDYGAQKYERASWRDVALDRWDAAQRRHQLDIDTAVIKRDVFDDESGLLHRAHQITGLIIMLQLEIEQSGKSIKHFLKFNDPPQDHKKKRKTRSDKGVTHARKEVLAEQTEPGCNNCRPHEQRLGPCSETNGD